MELGRSYDSLISTMGFPILVRCHLYIESGPRVLIGLARVAGNGHGQGQINSGTAVEFMCAIYIYYCTQRKLGSDTVSIGPVRYQTKTVITTKCHLHINVLCSTLDKSFNKCEKVKGRHADYLIWSIDRENRLIVWFDCLLDWTIINHSIVSTFLLCIHNMITAWTERL